MRGVVGQGVSRAVCGGWRRSGSCQQGGLVESSLREDGRRGGEGGVRSGGRKTLEKETQKLNIYTQSGPSHDALSARTDLPVVTCSMEKYTYTYDMMSGVFNVLQHTSNFDTTMSHYGRLDFNNPMRNKPVHSEREGQASEK